ncbi:MAG: RNA pyrophosphohydrolase [Pseudomonadales bacterium]|nr:RNA pyrophosphohydrolase [Pseudomonadales bacterium]
MIDNDGFRPNVGIILANQAGEVLWARRVGQDAWQFPQGGIKQNEVPEEALYRELYEEVGLKSDEVEVVAETAGWLKYKLPKKYIRLGKLPVCIGQKQKWFLLRLLAEDKTVSLDHGEIPEFDDWRWVSYWYPLRQVVSFKKEVYRQALKELSPSLQKIVTN